MAAKGYNPNRKRTGQFTSSGGNQARAAMKKAATGARGSSRAGAKASSARARANAAKLNPVRQFKMPSTSGSALPKRGRSRKQNVHVTHSLIKDEVYGDKLLHEHYSSSWDQKAGFGGGVGYVRSFRPRLGGAQIRVDKWRRTR